MNIRLIEVGRGKVTRTIEVPDGSTPDQIAEDIAEEARKHLMSSEVGATWDTAKGEGTITVGGWRPVGKAKLESLPKA